jgi:diguanylate cyclase (GGDEF)-like protein
MLLVSAFAITACAVTTQWLSGIRAEEYRVERARLCAAALIPGSDGDLTTSVALLRSRYEDLVAIAALSPTGRIDAVYPDTPAHRATVAMVIERGGTPVAVPSPAHGEPFRVAGAVVPLNGVASPATREVFICFREERDARRLAGALAVCALLVGMVALAGTGSVARWVDRRVARPLCALARMIERARTRPDGVPILEAETWCETARLCALFEDLMLKVAKGEAHIRWIMRETQRELADREEGFDRQLRRAKDQATLDPLTGLRNRSFYDEQLETLFARNRTDGCDFSAVIIDVDNFKRYNDTCGHQAGDSVLEFIGALMRGSTRPADFAIRYGGDEFVLLLPNTTLDQAVSVADRLVRLFAQYTTRLGRDHQLSLSAGVASLRRGRHTSGFDLVADADTALYTAKRTSKGTVLAHDACAPVSIDRSSTGAHVPQRRPLTRVPQPPCADSMTKT